MPCAGLYICNERPGNGVRLHVGAARFGRSVAIPRLINVPHGQAFTVIGVAPGSFIGFSWALAVSAAGCQPAGRLITVEIDEVTVRPVMTTERKPYVLAVAPTSTSVLS